MSGNSIAALIQEEEEVIDLEEDIQTKAKAKKTEKQPKKSKKWKFPSVAELQELKFVGDDNEDNRPILTEQCSVKYFLSIDARHVTFDAGKIIIEEKTTDIAHSVAVAHFVQKCTPMDHFMVAGVDTTLYLPNGSILEPDASLTPENIPRPGTSTPNGAPWPTVVLEVCNSRSLQVGIDKAKAYLAAGTGVQIVIIIKIYPRNPNGVAMVALRFERAVVGPSYAVSFGTQALTPQSAATIKGLLGAPLVGVGTEGEEVPSCNEAGIETYQLRLPVKLMTVGVNAALLPPILPLFYNLDLFTFQSCILREYPFT